MKSPGRLTSPKSKAARSKNEASRLIPTCRTTTITNSASPPEAKDSQTKHQTAQQRRRERAQQHSTQHNTTHTHHTPPPALRCAVSPVPQSNSLLFDFVGSPLILFLRASLEGLYTLTVSPTCTHIAAYCILSQSSAARISSDFPLPSFCSLHTHPAFASVSCLVLNPPPTCLTHPLKKKYRT